MPVTDPWHDLARAVRPEPRRSAQRPDPMRWHPEPVRPFFPSWHDRAHPDWYRAVSRQAPCLAAAFAGARRDGRPWRARLRHLAYLVRIGAASAGAIGLAWFLIAGLTW